MGDTQVFVGTAAYNGDVAAFFTRWLRSVRDAQREDGRFNDIKAVFNRKYVKADGEIEGNTQTTYALAIAPRIGGGLTWVKATYDSPAGRIESGWKVADDKLTLDVVIPPNTNATIRIPSRDGKAQTKQVGPGKHTFTATWTK